MLIFTEQLIALLLGSRHESISFIDISRIRAIETITPYSDKPMFVIIEIVLDAGGLDTAETVDGAAETVDAAEITLVRIILSPFIQFILSINPTHYTHQSYLKFLAQSRYLVEMSLLCKSCNIT